jgi:hypothetical protein
MRWQKSSQYKRPLARFELILLCSTPEPRATSKLHAEPVAHLSRSLPLLALARCLQNGQVIFFGSRVTHSRSACAPQTPVGNGVSWNISSTLASA